MVICHQYRLKPRRLSSTVMIATQKQQPGWKQCVLRMSVKPPMISVDKAEAVVSNLSLAMARRRESQDASRIEAQHIKTTIE
jgi:hypothetical protein